MVRVIKLCMKEEHELRYKYAALQVAITDLENIADDLNKIKTRQELKNFIPYEQLLDKCDELEKEYYDLLNKPKYDGIREDGKKHDPDVFYKHMLFLGVALNVWDYPSRMEKYKMEVIDDIDQAEDNKNYVLIPGGDLSHKRKECEITLVFNEKVKEHKPIKYSLNSSGIQQLNIRLCNLLKYSFRVYPRPYLFVNRDCFRIGKMNKVSSSTVSTWLSTIYKNKNLGIDTFRSAFVSYYFPKFNNRQRQIMKIRMRTSVDVMMRSYLKIYKDPFDLVQVKVSPDADLNLIANYGANEPVDPEIQEVPGAKDVGNANIAQNNNEDAEDDEENPETLLERKRRNFKQWYQKENNKNKKQMKLRDPLTYAKRYVRELNAGVIEIDRLHKNTLKKYKIVYDSDAKSYRSELE
jgi:hypothetical protein